MKTYKYNLVKDLYSFWNSFFENVYLDHCKDCQFPDCMGYIFLLKSEKNTLYENNVPLLTLNEDIVIINSLKYDIDKANFDVEEIKPKCYLMKNGKCSIYDIRPLVCRMYPFAFYFENEKTYLVIHSECKYTIDCFFAKKTTILKQLNEMINNTNPDLLKQTVDAFKNINDISMFPDEEKNEVIKLIEVNYEL